MKPGPIERGEIRRRFYHAAGMDLAGLLLRRSKIKAERRKLP
jgi:hypothetical protein